MTQLTDNYGRSITVTQEDGFDVYRVDDGLELRFETGWSESRALDTINAMAPEGWTPPPAETPAEALDQLKAIMAAMGITELKL